MLLWGRAHGLGLGIEPPAREDGRDPIRDPGRGACAELLGVDGAEGVFCVQFLGVAGVEEVLLPAEEEGTWVELLGVAAEDIPCASEEFVLPASAGGLVADGVCGAVLRTGELGAPPKPALAISSMSRIRVKFCFLLFNAEGTEVACSA